MNVSVASSTECTLNLPHLISIAKKVKQTQNDLLCKTKQMLKLCFFKKSKGECKAPSFTHPQEQEHLSHAINHVRKQHLFVFSAMRLQYKTSPPSRKNKRTNKKIPNPLKYEKFYAVRAVCFHNTFLKASKGFL